jgi:opacity protein-like surface antigen
MNKKVLVIALVLVLAVGSAFAANSLFSSKKADMKVGAQLGFGARSLTVTGKESLKNTSANVLNMGFYGAFTFEYGVSDAVSLKAEAGINTMGKAKSTLTLAGITGESESDSSSTPVNFTIFAGALYNIELNKELALYVGGGLDMMIGKLSSDEDAKTNAAIGLGLEAGASYAIDKNLSINAGGKFGWHFLNTNDDVQESTVGDNHSTTNISYKFYAGVTYSI